MSDEREFFKAVAEMRRLQKLYFKERDVNILREAKAQEKVVDQLVKDGGQQKLFDDGLDQKELF